jgi:antitoxin PrlF
MASATVTSKGQVTIPVEVRNQLGLATGDWIEFILNDETGHCEVVPVTRSVTALKGVIRKPAKLVSIEDMNAAIAAQGGENRGPKTHQVAPGAWQLSPSSFFARESVCGRCSQFQ